VHTLPTLLLLAGSLSIYTAPKSPPQPPLAPQPSADRLRCSADTLNIYLSRTGDRRQTGTVIDECRSAVVGGERVLMRVYRSTDAVLGSRTDTIVDAWSTLAPRSYHSHATSGTTTLDWAGRQVRGQAAVPGGGPKAISETLADGVYNSASFDVVLRASLLKVGTTLAIPSYVPGKGTVALSAKVVAEESVAGQSAWRVDGDFDGMSVTFWISTTTRQLLRQVMRVAPGVEVEFVLASSRGRGA
jgi:hypothetical protein